jgi:hypothetical protein
LGFGVLMEGRGAARNGLLFDSGLCLPSKASWLTQWQASSINWHPVMASPHVKNLKLVTVEAKCYELVRHGLDEIQWYG